MPRAKKPDPIHREKPKAPDLRLYVSEVPAADDSWTDDVRAAWVAFWGSEIAPLVSVNLHLQPLRRLFGLYSRLERISREVEENPYLAGSQGQQVINPLFRVEASLLGEVRQLEDRFGGNLRSAVGLGLALGQAKRTLRDLGEVKPVDDPRRESIDTESG